VCARLVEATQPKLLVEDMVVDAVAAPRVREVVDDSNSITLGHCTEGRDREEGERGIKVWSSFLACSDVFLNLFAHQASRAFVFGGGEGVAGASIDLAIPGVVNVDAALDALEDVRCCDGAALSETGGEVELGKPRCSAHAGDEMDIVNGSG